MAVTAEENAKSYSCDGTTTDFSFSFSIIGTDTSVLKIIIWEDATSTKTELSEDSGTYSYTVAAPNNNYEDGGTISTTKLDGVEYVPYAWSSDYTITIERIVPYKQSSEFTAGGLDPVALENTFDNLEYQIQQIDKRKSIHSPPSDPTGLIYELPSVSARASKVIGFDASGNVIAIANVPTSAVSATAFMETLLDDTTAAAAQATLKLKDSSASLSLLSLNLSTVTPLTIITKSPWFDIRAFGAVADGESDITAAPSGTNNTTVIQAALDAANSAGGGNILVPPGIFEHASILTIYSNTRLYAENYGASALRFTGDGGVGITTYTAENFITLEQLMIFTSDKDNGDSQQGAVGFRIQGTSSEIKILNCNIQGYSLGGILFAGAMNNVTIDGGYIGNCGDNNGAAILSPSGITSANAIRIVNITLGSNNGWGIKHADEGKGWYIAGCLIEGNVDGGVTLARLNGCEIIGNYFENTAASTVQINLQDLATAYNTGIDIRGNWFSGHADDVRISLDYVDGIVIEANHFQTTTANQIEAVIAARVKNFRFGPNYDSGSAAFYYDGASSFDSKVITDIGEMTRTIDITSTQIKALTGSPKELIPIPGSGYFIEVISAVLTLDYGSEVFAEPSAPDDLAIEYDNGSGEQIAIWDTTGFIENNADAIEIVNVASLGGGASAITAAANVNKNVVLINTGGNYTGNASNDSAIRVVITYRVHTSLGL